MLAVVRVFKLFRQKYLGKFNLYKTSTVKVFYTCTKKIFSKFEISRIRQTGFMYYYKKKKNAGQPHLTNVVEQR